MPRVDNWDTVLFAGAVLCAVLVGTLILWLRPVEAAGVLALLASVPFIILARFAWRRRSQAGRRSSSRPARR